MARKFLYIIAALIMLFVGGVALFFIFQDTFLRWALRPAQEFSELTPPPAPDYADAVSWAALPERDDDHADIIPTGLPEVARHEDVDVFFVHPTTYLSDAGWNAPIDDAEAKDRVDVAVMKHMASAFSACCNVFAPYYRQATIWSFLEQKTDSGHEALSFAYGDVRRAFEQFLDNRTEANRPLILASHSQGTYHLLTLLRDPEIWPRIKDRLVAVYAIGFGVPTDMLTREIEWLEVCETADQTGCMINYNTYAYGGDPSDQFENTGHWFFNGYEWNRGKHLVCTNPAQWAEHPIRSITFAPEKTRPEARPLPNLNPSCEDGILYISPPEEGYGQFVLPGQNYHVFDYLLLYSTVYEDAARRAAAFSAAR